MTYLLSDFLIFLAILYFIGLFIIRRGFLSLHRGRSKEQPAVTVIISAHNEKGRIISCLRALVGQQYPFQKLEILVVDDRSTDGTAEVVREYASRHNQIKLLQVTEMPRRLAPKKHAISLGIRHAKGELIFTTDADCVPGPKWIEQMVNYFEPEVGLVAGFNPYKVSIGPQQLFYEMLSLDYFAMAAISAAMSGLNFPVSCSGGNLAYRKKVFDEVGGFKEIGQWVSGDDDFLMERIRKTTSWKIRYATRPTTFVPTRPPDTYSDFLHQRIRYASKTRHYDRPVVLALSGVFLLNLLIVLGPFIALISPSTLLAWVPCLILKSTAEFLFLEKASGIFTYPIRTSVFGLCSLLHPIYIVSVGILGQFKDFKWKDKTYSAKMPVAEVTPNLLNENPFRELG